MQTEYDFVWPQPQSLIQTSDQVSPSQAQTSSQGSSDPLKASSTLSVSQHLHTRTPYSQHPKQNKTPKKARFVLLS